MLGRLQHRLGGDASNVHAGAAEGLVLLDADGGEAELGAANGGDVSAWAPSENKDIRW